MHRPSRGKGAFDQDRHKSDPRARGKRLWPHSTGGTVLLGECGFADTPHRSSAQGPLKTSSSSGPAQPRTVPATNLSKKPQLRPRPPHFLQVSGSKAAWPNS